MVLEVGTSSSSSSKPPRIHREYGWSTHSSTMFGPQIPFINSTSGSAKETCAAATGRAPPRPSFPVVLRSEDFYKVAFFEKAEWLKDAPIYKWLPQFGYSLSVVLFSPTIPLGLLSAIYKKGGPKKTAALIAFWLVWGEIITRRDMWTGDGLDKVWNRFEWILQPLFENVPMIMFPLKAVPYMGEPGHRIVFTHDLEKYPSPNFVFAMHPHGILNLVNGLAFDRGGYRVRNAIPKLDMRLAGLETVFKVPINREFLLYLYGAIGVGASSLRYQLMKKKRSVGIVVGGAIEALFTSWDIQEATGSSCKGLRKDLGGADQAAVEAEIRKLKRRVNRMRLVLADRMGFIKMSILTGVPVVPVIGFGENALFRQHILSKEARALQLQLQKQAGYSFPLFYGSSKVFPLLPRRVTQVSVFGKPIDVGVSRLDLDIAIKKAQQRVAAHAAPRSNAKEGGLQGDLKIERIQQDAQQSEDEKFGDKLATDGVIDPFVEDLHNELKLETLHHDGPGLITTNTGTNPRQTFLTLEELSALPHDVLNYIVKGKHNQYLAEIRKLHAENAPLYGTEEDQDLELITTHQAKSAAYVEAILEDARKLIGEQEIVNSVTLNQDLSMLQPTQEVAAELAKLRKPKSNL